MFILILFSSTYSQEINLHFNINRVARLMLMIKDRIFLLIQLRVITANFPRA